MSWEETLEELLVQHGLLKPEQLEQAKSEAVSQQKTLEEVIQNERLVYPEPLAQLKAQALGVPYINLAAVQMEPAAMKDIAPKAAATYRFVAFSINEQTIQIAMANPEDHQALEAIRFVAKKQNRTPEIYCASPDSIEQLLQGDTSEQIDKALKEFGREIKDAKSAPPDSPKLQAVLEEAPISKVFAVIMRHATEGMASDVHIEPLGNELRVRYRISGKLHTSLLLPRAAHAVMVSRVKILANLQVSVSNIPQEGRFTFTADNQPYSVRVGIIPTTNGEKISLHLVDTSKPAPSFSELGLLGPQVEHVQQYLADPQGLLLVAGPDGSGKSTTLNAILAHLNTPNTNISTVEETIEYTISGVTQTRLQPQQDVTYAQVIEHNLRQDVDVIMVEEIHDAQTAHLVTKGALAGRTMLSTVNAPSALSSIPQLRDLGVSPYVLSASLRLIISQRLVPKLCQACKQEIDIPKKYRDDIEAQLKNISDEHQKAAGIDSSPSLYESPGCPECQERSTQGQIALFGVTPITKELAQDIADDADMKTLITQAQKKGYLTVQQDGLLKALQGIAAYQDVVRATAVPEHMQGF